MSKKGGGTLTLKKGTYNLTNAILVPSNNVLTVRNADRFAFAAFGEVHRHVSLTNWKNAVIKGNTFDTVSGWNNGSIQQEKFGIFMKGGVIDPVISDNTFNNVYMPFYAKGNHNIFLEASISIKWPSLKLVNEMFSIETF